MKTFNKFLKLFSANKKRTGVLLVVCAVIVGLTASLQKSGGGGQYMTDSPWSLASNNPLLNQGEVFYADVEEPRGTPVKDFTDTPEVSLQNVKQMVEKLTRNIDLPASDVDAYKIHDDGGLIFDPIYQEAVKTGILGKYAKAHLTKGTLKLGDSTLTYEIPKNATAYDTVPIKYTITTKSDTYMPIHVQAAAGEESARVKDGAYYDSNLPNHVELQFDYLGYVAADFDMSTRPQLNTNESTLADSYRIARLQTAAGSGSTYSASAALIKNIRLLTGTIDGLHTLYLRNVDAGAVSVKGIRLIRPDNTYTDISVNAAWSNESGSAVKESGAYTGFGNGSILKIEGVDFGADAYNRAAVLLEGAAAGKTVDLYLDKLPTSYNEEKLGTEYPNAALTELINSTELRTADEIWFRVRYTNTGDTIIVPDGNGYTTFIPVLQRKNVSGAWDTVAPSPNSYKTMADTIYPGESRETWFAFPPFSLSTAGEYRVQITCFTNRIAQAGAGSFSMMQDQASSQAANHSQVSYYDFTIKEQAAVVSPQNTRFANKSLQESLTRNEWVHTFQELLNTYDTWLAPVAGHTYTGWLYLQVANWTDGVSLKLINEETGSLAAVRCPINIDSDSVKINFNPNNNAYIINDKGEREPMVITQNMTDMRTNFALGPNAGEIITNQLLDMREAGINTLTSTNGFFYDAGKDNAKSGMTWNHAADAFKFSTDLARLLGMKYIGHMSYPYAAASANISETLGEQVTTAEGTVGFSEPLQQLNNAVKAITLYHRWGDTFWRDPSGKMPFYLEDTRGRIDIYRQRFAIGDQGKTEFQKFLTAVYTNIAALNSDWKTSYTGFDKISPQDSAQKDIFKDYSKPMRVFDIFRTKERVDSYNNILQMMSGSVKDPKIFLSQENESYIVQGVNPQSTNPRYRALARDWQSVGALIPEIIAASGVVTGHSSYSNINWRPSEVYEMVSREAAQGIIPMWTGLFSHAYDAGENPEFGGNQEQQYNSASNLKTTWITVRRSAFLWWAATYEAGGAPGTLWEDYACNAVIFQNQKREMMFFAQKLKEALNTSEGRAWAKKGGVDGDDIPGKWSYEQSYVESVLTKVQSTRKPGQLIQD